MHQTDNTERAKAAYGAQDGANVMASPFRSFPILQSNKYLLVMITILKQIKCYLSKKHY